MKEKDINRRREKEGKEEVGKKKKEEWLKKEKLKMVEQRKEYRKIFKNIFEKEGFLGYDRVYINTE